jgi:hypothetical protein
MNEDVIQDGASLHMWTEVVDRRIQDIQREPGSLDCDCGKEITRWDGSRSCSKIRTPEVPTITTAELIADTGMHIPADSAIEVSPIQTHEWDRQKRASTTYRTITYEGQTMRVREQDLLAAAVR